MDLLGDSTVWRAVPSKSSPDSILWQSNEDATFTLRWHFEGLLKKAAFGENEDGDGADDGILEDDPDIDKSDILDPSVKRRRGRVDYIKLDKTLGKGSRLALPLPRIIILILKARCNSRSRCSRR